ncbi:MAG: methyltransferase domain-containing protein [Pseudomonadota bacterium]
MELKDAYQPRPNRDEQAKKSFARALRRHVLTTMAGDLRSQYDERVEPGYRASHGESPADGPTVHKLMKSERPFRFYSATRVNAQEMVYASVVPTLERSLDAVNAAASDARAQSQAVGGTLSLDPAIEVPRSVTAVDVHRTPGGYTGERSDEDISQGLLYDQSMDVFAFGQFGEDYNDIGMTVANYVRLKYPELNPQRILDCGCTVGHNTLPWAQTFPMAEVHAIDVAAPVLRFAHTRAQSYGVPVHFKQMNATQLDYADNSFDVVFSSMFLHELPLADIRAYMAEAFRVLKPGGLLINMELPPNARMGAYESFYLDWDCYYNNEPYYKTFRDQDYQELCTSAGFVADAFVEVTLPRYTFVGEEAFTEALDAPTRFDSQTGRMDPKGTRWYVFGAFKNSVGA